MINLMWREGIYLQISTGNKREKSDHGEIPVMKLRKGSSSQTDGIRWIHVRMIIVTTDLVGVELTERQRGNMIMTMNMNVPRPAVGFRMRIPIAGESSEVGMTGLRGSVLKL